MFAVDDGLGALARSGLPTFVITDTLSAVFGLFPWVLLLMFLYRKRIDRAAKNLEDLLKHPKKILGVISDELSDLKKRFGDARCTHISEDGGESTEFKEEDLVQDEGVLITLTQRGYIKRTSATAYRSQAVGGKGVTGHTTREEDEVLFMFPARTLQTVLFFSDKGKVYSEKVYQIPDADRTGKGISIYNVLALGAGEKITAALAVASFTSHGYCIMATTSGKIKRVDLEDFASVRPSGMMAMGLENGDELGWAHLTSGENEIILVTEMGRALRYSEKKVRSMGRAAGGVQGIRLGKDDRLAGMEVVEPGGALLVVTQKGFGKQTMLEEYIPKGRGSLGVTTTSLKSVPQIGRIVTARVVQASDDLTLISANGIVLRLKVSSIKEAGRATKGVHLIRLQDGDGLAAIARIPGSALVKAAAETGETPPSS